MTRIGDRKAPINSRLLHVALVLPGRDFSLERSFVGYTTVEALVLQNTQLDLGHVQPTAMLGCVMKLDMSGNSPSRRSLKPCIQSSQIRGIATAKHGKNHPRLG